MRSRKNATISAQEVHHWAVQWLLESRLLKDHGWLCKPTVVWNVVLHAAARMNSVFAACRDLADAPSQQGVFNALADGLPRTLKVLEKRLNWALTTSWPHRLKARPWNVGIDLHLNPYYGEPERSRNEIYYGQPRQGTAKFHAYATACIVQYGERYTLALTWVRRHESLVTVLERLLARIEEMGLKIRCLLLDRGFFNVPVAEYLQGKQLPFLMPVVFRGRRPKKIRPNTLHWIKRQKAGWYPHTMKRGQRTVSICVCVSYRSYWYRKSGKRRNQKLLFAAWRVHGSPTQIREAYRKRFGIESSFRQMRQARICTCTRNPHLRLVFVAVALILRNLWVWLHATVLADKDGDTKILRLERLRFKQLLDWIAQVVSSLLHDGSMPYVSLAA